MQAFPEHYVSHNLPLIVLSGIGGDEEASSDLADSSKNFLQEGGFRIRRETAPVGGPAADRLLQAFLDNDSSSNGSESKSAFTKDGPGAFRIKKVGRTYGLPPRKAPPPPHAPRLGPLSDGHNPPPLLSLHSTISPLTPSSPLYPDGIMTHLWITKHQSRLPAVLISFFGLTGDPNLSSLRDNQIKTEIGNMRTVCSSTNYKTRLVVVLTAEAGTDAPVDVDERLGSIKRATGLDSKNLFFLAPGSSKENVADFVRSLLNSLQSSCVEYYRDLSKHARRKRNRTTVPPPTTPPSFGTSQTLPMQGWNVRYEFKLGVFAEFRQEMDAACRNYESAYEGLFSSELFETISSWTPRFNETRLLADATAIRILRCLLWTGQSSSAARFWLKHRRRTRDMVNRRGKGSENYGWEAWESIWSQAFAQLVASTRGLEISLPASIQPETPLLNVQFCTPERSMLGGDRIQPWELLHHEGYWSNKAWKHTRQRRQLAYQMPVEDRTAPGQSPASAIANRSHLYDTYLALEPHLEYPLGDRKGYNYTDEILNGIRSAVCSFSARSQNRFVELLRLEEAREHLRTEQWHEALRTIDSIWPCLSWRRAGWWKLVAEAASTFREAARQMNDPESLLRIEWEACCSAVPLTAGWRSNLDTCLKDIDTAESKPIVVINSNDSLSPLWACLIFGQLQGSVGEPLKAQLALTSTARRASEPIRLSEAKVIFEGGLRPIHILSDQVESPSQEPSVLVSEMRLHETPSSAGDTNSASPKFVPDAVVGKADMLMRPGQRRVFNLTCLPREAGEVRVSSIALVYETKRFSLTYIINQRRMTSNARWWSLHGQNSYARQLGCGNNVDSARIMPKPPKVRVDFPNLKDRYYTGEKISLAVVVRNDEEDTADVFVAARLLSPLKHEASIYWDGTAETDSFALESGEKDVPPKEFLSLPGRSIGSIPSGGTHNLTFVMDDSICTTDHELELTANYHLADDPETRLDKITTVVLRVKHPFEANCEFLPRLDSAPWPNSFDPATVGTGLTQQFLLLSKITSSTTDRAVIEKVSLSSQGIIGNAVCIIDDEKTPDVNQKSPTADEARGSMAPGAISEFKFTVWIRKNTLGDRDSVAVDFDLALQWRRSPEADLITSSLEVPRFLIPMAEPRVLLSKRQGDDKNIAGLIRVQYTVENPSMHYLTFNLAMESSDEFAFSGPKAITFSLVPTSRHSVHYRIVAFQRERWVRLSLGVQDAYFMKSLRIIPASEGIRSDGKRGLLVWID